MAFIKWQELPKDIRLMIIEETIQITRQEHEEDDRSSGVTKPFLFPFSAFDDEWNRAVEMITFNSITVTPDDLPDFAKICSKRYARLNTIRLFISNEDIPIDVQPEHYVGNVIVQFFRAMHDWAPLDREPQGLMEVQLDVADFSADSPAGFNISTELGALPNVPIIGALYEVVEEVLHPSSSLRLYQNLPNARRVNLNLRYLDDETASIQQASNDIASLGTIQPSLTHLELLPAIRWDHQISKSWIPARNCIAAFPGSWYNSLVHLGLQRVNDLPLFFAKASEKAWPNLKTLGLLGEVDSTNKTRKQLEDMNKQTCTDLVRGLITMLPKTPNITKILIEMVDFSVNYHLGSFRLELCIGNPVRQVQTGFGSCSYKFGPVRGFEAGIGSCSYKFVPNYDSGTVVAAGTDFSGHVATELQHTVRHHQLKDVVVFSHRNEWSTWGRGRFCWQWAPEENSWDVVFENEADEFIYQMGQYIDLVIEKN